MWCDEPWVLYSTDDSLDIMSKIIIKNIQVQESSFWYPGVLLSTTHFLLRIKPWCSFWYTDYLSNLGKLSLQGMCSVRSQVPSVLAFKGQWGSVQCRGGLFHHVILLKLHETSRTVKTPRNAETYFFILSNNGINLSKEVSCRRKNQLCCLVMS